MMLVKMVHQTAKACGRKYAEIYGRRSVMLVSTLFPRSRFPSLRMTVLASPPLRPCIRPWETRSATSIMVFFIRHDNALNGCFILKLADLESSGLLVVYRHSKPRWSHATRLLVAMPNFETKRPAIPFQMMGFPTPCASRVLSVGLHTWTFRRCSSYPLSADERGALSWGGSPIVASKELFICRRFAFRGIET